MSRFQRRHQFREPKKFFIIATEGECTENIYFSALKPPRDAAIQLKILPTKKGKSAPKEVLARLKSYDREAGSGPRDELWLVVDRDFWTTADLDAVATAIGELPKYHLALSNPCFELWLVLHRRDPAGHNSEQLRRVLKESWAATKRACTMFTPCCRQWLMQSGARREWTVRPRKHGRTTMEHTFTGSSGSLESHPANEKRQCRSRGLPNERTPGRTDLLRLWRAC